MRTRPIGKIVIRLELAFELHKTLERLKKIPESFSGQHNRVPAPPHVFGDL
jgi:hypothetical protein